MYTFNKDMGMRSGCRRNQTIYATSPLLILVGAGIRESGDADEAISSMAGAAIPRGRVPGSASRPAYSVVWGRGVKRIRRRVMGRERRRDEVWALVAAPTGTLSRLQHCNLDQYRCRFLVVACWWFGYV
jgi:hypothetical protein